MSEKMSIQPLAARMRPLFLNQFIGQAHLLDEGKLLNRIIAEKYLPSLIFWGPPGTGKTTLALLLASSIDAHVEKLSAVLASVKDIRDLMAQAKERLKHNQKTVLFIDEIHRFNKAQQDGFLPHVEDGTIILIGATTENPSFELNNALLSRTRVVVLKPLSFEDMQHIIAQALTDQERGYGQYQINFPQHLQQQLIEISDGDARRCLNLLETLLEYAIAHQAQSITITEEMLQIVLTDSVRRFDKHGDIFHDQISALHKAIRGSNPDAALYWFCRMIDGGCDPLYIIRRLIRAASEDIGNADPRALQLAMNAWDVYERLGSPEGELTIAQTVIYLACAAKSNASYVAFNQAMRDAKQSGSLAVPLHLCNAPTKLMKELGYAKHYRYAHDEEHAYAAGEHYFPENVKERQYYFPVDRGLEAQIKQKLEFLKTLDKEKKK